jgi:Transglutaminase-like superfamily
MPPESRNTPSRGAGDAVRQDMLGFYMRPAAMTSGGEYAAMLAALPNDIGALVRIVQGLALHEYMASAYGVTIPEQRRSESHIRRIDRMLDRLLAEDARPLTVARPPQKRLVGVCHHFMLLLVAMLRAKGIPARGRCGFATYFNPGYFEDHVVCEYWNAAEARWIRLEPQSDEVWRKMLKIDFDPLDVPPDRFLIAADAWVRCRAGDADPSKFGIFKGDLRGLWFIAGSLVHDVAALNKMEMLQWDVWGAMPRPDEPLQDDQLAFFDRLAALTRAPDSSFAELRNLYEQDDCLRMPATVFNAVLNRPEAI